MSAHLVPDEPRDKHDGRCAVWTTHSDPCDCRDAQGHAPRIDTDHPATRADFEVAWRQMPLRERAAELDRIAAGGHR